MSHTPKYQEAFDWADWLRPTVQEQFANWYDHHWKDHPDVAVAYMKFVPPAENMIAIDLALWTNLAEVRNYAGTQGISMTEAIRDLVNAGLSHLE